MSLATHHETIRNLDKTDSVTRKTLSIITNNYEKTSSNDIEKPSTQTKNKNLSIVTNHDKTSSGDIDKTFEKSDSLTRKALSIITNTIEAVSNNTSILSPQLSHPSSPSHRFDSNIVNHNDIVFIEPQLNTPAAAALAANAAIKVSKVSKGFKKIRGKLKSGLKMKNLNIVRKIKKTTKVNRFDHFKRNFKGKVIKEGEHELYTLTAAMNVGIRCLMSRNDLSSYEKLNIDDFNFVSKQTFPPKGCNIPPNISPPHSLGHTFKFKSYAPKVFGRIREFFGIDKPAYMQSVCDSYDYLEFMANSKSGQFFFYTMDGRYMIKTQTKEENKFLRRILPHYFKYVNENPHTFLVKMLGMHRLKMYHLKRKVHFVIMSSVFDTAEIIHTIYDLKGSLVGRKVSQEDREKGAVLKDMNLIEDKKKFKLGPKKPAFIEQLKRDARFLATLNIMDYSLLIGIHDRNKRILNKEPSQHLSSVSGGDSSPGHKINNLSIETNEKIAKNLDDISPTPVHSNLPFRKNIYGPGYNYDGKRPDYSHQTSINTTVTSEDSMASTVAPLNSTSLELPIQTPTRLSPADKSKSVDFSNRKKVVRMSLTPKGRQQSENKVKFNFVEHDESNDVDDEQGDDEVDDDEFEEVNEEIIEEEDEHFDDGDSDYGLFESLADHSNSNSNNKIIVPNLNIINPSNSSDRPVSCETVDIDGSGSSGFEGSNLPNLFRSNEVLVDLTKRSYSTIGNSPEVVFGPADTRKHPWTTRHDYGINSRLSNNERGNEIYYVGIIDILQQYNGIKKAENFFKGFQFDKKLISSVDSKTYAERFIKFIDENIE